MSIDGINTQGENIADNGGIKQAFRVSISINNCIIKKGFMKIKFIIIDDAHFRLMKNG